VPNLFALLEETMLFTAARGAGKDPLSLRLHPGDRVEVPEPRPVKSDDPATVLVNPIWQWTHDAAFPATFDHVTVKHRDMGHRRMKVLDRVEFEDVVVTEHGGGRTFTLPIQSRFVATKFFLPSGRIPDADAGWWRLESEVDASLLLVFAYQLRAGALQPLSLKELDVLGDDLMPPRGSASSLYSCTIDGSHGATARVCVPRFLLAVSLTCGKERNDCEPGQLLGAARLWPQVMAMSNVRLGGISAPIHLVRPGKTDHQHHEEMEREVGAVYFTDTNRDGRTWRAGLGEKAGPPLPYWDNIFDYYDVSPFDSYHDKKPDPFQDPKQLERGEVCFVDARMKKQRIVSQMIQRAAYPSRLFTSFEGYLDKAYEAPELFKKMPFQGEFDNVHLATRMRLEFPFGARGEEPWPTRVEKGIVMAPFCVHDCFHTHLRWGEFAQAKPPKSNVGFDDDGNPNSQRLSPLVPRNQSVFVKLTAPHALRYRAFVHTVLPGHWQVINHHGSYYAIGAWPGDGRMDLVPKAISLLGAVAAEPFTNTSAGDFPSDSWAATYWRLRFGGWQLPDRDEQHIIERLRILDLKECRYGTGGT
jgi:hypothetical protein